MALQNIIIAVGGMIVQSVVNGFGLTFIAGYTATNKLYGAFGDRGGILWICGQHLCWTECRCGRDSADSSRSTCGAVVGGCNIGGHWSMYAAVWKDGIVHLPVWQ